MKRTRKNRKVSYGKLDRFEKEARSGATDDWLSIHSGVPVSTVIEWRRERKILRTNGAKQTVFALDPFRDQWEGGLQKTTGSAVGGRFKIPELVLRNEMNYDMMARMTYYAYNELGMSPKQIGSAMGLWEEDVEMAISIETSHLNRVGVPCFHCGAPTDPKFGKYCTARCARLV